MRRRNSEAESPPSLEHTPSILRNDSQEVSCSQVSQLSSTGMSEDLNAALTIISPSSVASSSAAATIAFDTTTTTLDPVPPVRWTRSSSRTTAATTATAASSATMAMAATSTPSTPPILSWGKVCVVKRPSTHTKQKEVKLYALQNTFFAYPVDTDAETASEIDSKIQRVAQNFEIQRYETEIMTFGLPFEVEAIGCFTDGHGNMAKKFTIASSPSKRKRGTVSSSSSSAGSSSDDEEEAVAATNEPSRRTVTVKRKKA